jgi:hypothetical protein
MEGEVTKVKVSTYKSQGMVFLKSIKETNRNAIVQQKWKETKQNKKRSRKTGKACILHLK